MKILNADLTSEDGINKQRERVQTLKEKLNLMDKNEDVNNLLCRADYLVKNLSGLIKVAMVGLIDIGYRWARSRACFRQKH
jgi:CDP-glycerol glycerophosphotransferase (TagB/SpsB family)